jgi:hypothetical protein
MSGLRDFLENQDVGVTSTGNGLHIGTSFIEHALAFVDMFEWVTPTYLATGVPAMGFATVAGVTLAFVGPVLGTAGVFMALGSGYAEAREEIQNEAVASGFSQGFVAGILNMSPGTVSSLFAQHGVIPNHPMDREADILEMKARNRGVVAGYALANTATDEQKKSFVFEIREFTGHISSGNWTDRDKVDYVIAYAAKLRLHFLNAE